MRILQNVTTGYKLIRQLVHGFTAWEKNYFCTCVLIWKVDNTYTAFIILHYKNLERYLEIIRVLVRHIIMRLSPFNSLKRATGRENSMPAPL